MSYSFECDRLAAIEARKTGKRIWYRWHLERIEPHESKMPVTLKLVTKIMRPAVGDHKPSCDGLYEIVLPKILHESDIDHWLELLVDKDWIGGFGRAELEKAFKDLIMGGAAGRLLLDTAKRFYHDDRSL